MNFPVARFFLWIFIGLSLALGAGVYLKFQGKNEGQAAQTLGVAHTEALTGTSLGLVGYWTLDGNDTKWSDSATEIKDTSGSAKHGDAQGALATGSVRPGRVGQGILFNGSSDLVSLGNVYNGVKTVALWVKPNSTTQSLIDLNATATVDINAGTVRGNNFTTPTVYVDGAATATFPDTNWHHIAITTATGINASAAYLGRISSSYLGGILDDVRFYSTALTATQVADLYRASGAKEVDNANHREALTNGLVGYWTFDGRDTKWSDTGTEIKDISGNNNHGAVSGLTTTSVIPGKLGQGMSFVNSGEINAGSASSLDNIELQGGGGLTVSAWVLVPSTPEGIYFLSKNSSGNIGWTFWLNSSNSLIFSRYYTTQILEKWTDGIPLGSWTHVVATWDGTANASGVNFYINGQLGSNAFSQNGTGTKSSDAASELILGSQYHLSTTQLKMDDARVYNRILSAGEILNLYNLGK